MLKNRVRLHKKVCGGTRSVECLPQYGLCVTRIFLFSPENILLYYLIIGTLA